MEKQIGYYFGTEINEKWYRRYTGDNMLARGRGEYWLDENGLYFLRTLTHKPIFISFSSIADIKTGRWHSGKWGQGFLVIKVIWNKDNERLSSGFILSKNEIEAINIADKIKNEIKKAV